MHKRRQIMEHKMTILFIGKKSKNYEGTNFFR